MKFEVFFSVNYFTIETACFLLW